MLSVDEFRKKETKRVYAFYFKSFSTRCYFVPIRHIYIYNSRRTLYYNCYEIIKKKQKIRARHKPHFYFFLFVSLQTPAFPLLLTVYKTQ